MKKILLFVVMLFFISCSAPYREAPVAINFKTQEQLKLQALSHWKIVADDLAKQLKINKNQKIFIKISDDTKFDKLFGTFFRSFLVKKGYKIFLDKNNADYIVNYDTNIVEFKDRYIPKSRDSVGSLVFLGSGVAVLRNASAEAGAVLGIAALEALNIYNSKKAYKGASIYEVNVNINVIEIKTNVIIDEINGIYYIVDNQKCLYSKCKKDDVVFYLKGE